MPDRPRFRAISLFEQCVLNICFVYNECCSITLDHHWDASQMNDDKPVAAPSSYESMDRHHQGGNLSLMINALVAGNHSVELR